LRLVIEEIYHYKSRGTRSDHPLSDSRTFNPDCKINKNIINNNENHGDYDMNQDDINHGYKLKAIAIQDKRNVTYQPALFHYFHETIWPS
jgi:hypothetical protein